MADEPCICIATHSGPFHGDDTLAVAILSTIFTHHRIVRTREQALLDMADIVVDVGGVYDHTLRRYDHHMAHPPTDKHEHLFSSAGLVWKHYSRAYLRAIDIPSTYTYRNRTIDLFDKIDVIIKTRWIVPIDRSDNGQGGGPTPISELVSAMMPIDAEKSTRSYNSQFLAAVSMVAHLFKRACFHAVDHTTSKLQFVEAKKEYLAQDRIVVVETDVRNFGNFVVTPAHFVIYPVTDYETDEVAYIIRPIYTPVAKVYKTPFPTNTLGLDRHELEALGLEGIAFVHHSGFTARADTRESAIAFCQGLLDQQDQQN